MSPSRVRMQRSLAFTVCCVALSTGPAPAAGLDAGERVKQRVARALAVIEAIPAEAEDRRSMVTFAATRDCRGYLSLPRDTGRHRGWSSANRTRLAYISAACAVIAGEAGAAHLLYRWADLAEAFDERFAVGDGLSEDAERMSDKLQRLRRVYGALPLGRALVRWNARHNPPRLTSLEPLSDPRARAMLAYGNRTLLETPRGRTHATVWLPAGRYRHLDEEGQAELGTRGQAMADLDVRPIAAEADGDHLDASCAAGGGSTGGSLVRRLARPAPPPPSSRLRTALGWGAVGLAAVSVGLSVADRVIGDERGASNHPSDRERLAYTGESLRIAWMTTGALALSSGVGWLVMTILEDPSPESNDAP